MRRGPDVIEVAELRTLTILASQVAGAAGEIEDQVTESAFLIATCERCRDAIAGLDAQPPELARQVASSWFFDLPARHEDHRTDGPGPEPAADAEPTEPLADAAETEDMEATG